MCPKRRTIIVLQALLTLLLSSSCFLVFAFASSRPIINTNNIVVTSSSSSSASSNSIFNRNHNFFSPNNNYHHPAVSAAHSPRGKRLQNWPLAAFHHRDHQNNNHNHNRGSNYHNSNNARLHQKRNFPKGGQRGYYQEETMCRPISTDLSATRKNQGQSPSPRGGGSSASRGRRRDGEALLPSSSSSSTSPNSRNTNSETSSLLNKLQKSNTYDTFSFSTITQAIASSKKAKGRAMLLLVSFLYGTLNVSLRGVYASEGAPVASVLSLVRQCLSILTFVPILWAVQNTKQKKNNMDTSEGMGALGEEEEDLENGRNTLDGEMKGIGKEKKRPMWLAALELAFWNFGAQGLINAGLLFSPAARASFLTQTSVVMTPLISALAGERVKSSVWGGCALALVGLGLISTSHVPTNTAVDIATTLAEDVASQRALLADGLASSSSSSISLNQGDFMILAGALSWSTYIFRTSSIAKSYSEIDLQFNKTVLLAVMYFGWFLTTAFSSISSAASTAATSIWSLFTSGGWIDAIAPLWLGWNSLPVWILLAYSAVGPGAVADLLQQTGQKEVSASESNIILCLESLFAAICAFVFLGEVSSTQEMAGGLLIVLAAILASK